MPTGAPSIEYYNNAEIPKFIGGDFVAEAQNITAENIIANFAEFFLARLFDVTDVVVDELTHGYAKVFTAVLANVVGDAVVQSIEIFVDADQRVSYDHGATWIEKPDVNLGTLGTAILALEAAAAFEGAGFLLATIGPGIAIGAAYSFAQDFVNTTVSDFVNGFYGLEPIDVRFYDKDGDHKEGVFYRDGMGTVTAAVEDLIGHSARDLSGGEIKFYNHYDEAVGDTYKIYDAGALTKIAGLVGMTLDALLATGPTGEKNIENYMPNANHQGFIFNIEGDEIGFHIPVSVNGVAQDIVVNNIYETAAGGGNTLVIGDGNHLLGNNIELVISESGGAAVINGVQDHANLMLGGASNETITGGDSSDTILGGGGNDSIIGSEGADVIDGGSGTNTLSFTATTENVTVDLFNHAASIHYTLSDDLQTIYNIENIAGGSGNDTLIGDDSANTLTGNAGDDRLVGSGGNDVLIGGAGNDTYVFLDGYGQDVVTDSDGSGSIVIGADTLSGTAAFSDDYNDRWTLDGHTLVTNADGSLSIDGGTANSISITGFNPGDFGITLGAADTFHGSDYTNITITPDYVVNFVQYNDAHVVINSGDTYMSILPAGSEWSYAYDAHGMQRAANITITGVSGSDAYTAPDNLANTITINSGAGDDSLTNTLNNIYYANYINAGSGNDMIQAMGGLGAVHGGDGDGLLEAMMWMHEPHAQHAIGSVKCFSSTV